MSANGWSGFMKKSQKQQLKSKSKPRSSNTKKRKSNPNSDNTHCPKRKKRRLSNIEHVHCPICNKDILSHLINFHMEDHFLEKNKNHNKTVTTSPQSPTKNTISNNNNDTKNNNNTASKICPLFTSGALPSSMFTKSTKRNSNKTTIPSQTAIFYVEIITDNSDKHIISWNAKWIDNEAEINTFLLKSKEMNYFITNVFIKGEPNTNSKTTKIYLITNYPSNKQPIDLISNDFKFAYPSPNKYRFSPSLIKSLLQKCTRVSFDSSAVKAAYLLLLKDNLQSLLRRLSIIIIEDVILIKDYILLIWLLLAESKSNINEKYHPKLCWYNWIFSLVKKCASCEIKDYMDFKLHPNQEQYINLFTPLQSDHSDDNNDVDNVNNDTDNKIQQLLIRTILIRASYGGMKCDVSMLRSYGCIWHNRFFGKTKCCTYYQQQLAKLKIPNDIKSIFKDDEFDQCILDNNWLLFINKLDEKYCKNGIVEMTEILAICDNDLILSAVDFHCSNMLPFLCNNGEGKCWEIIMEYLKGNYSVVYNNNNTKWKNNVEGLLKLIIWEFRSSQTDKMSLLMTEEKPEELFQLWTKIKPIVNDYSLTHFKNRKNYR